MALRANGLTVLIFRELEGGSITEKSNLCSPYVVGMPVRPYYEEVTSARRVEKGGTRNQNAQLKYQ